MRCDPLRQHFVVARTFTLDGELVACHPRERVPPEQCPNDWTRRPARPSRSGARAPTRGRARCRSGCAATRAPPEAAAGTRGANPRLRAGRPVDSPAVEPAVRVEAGSTRGPGEGLVPLWSAGSVRPARRSARGAPATTRGRRGRWPCRPPTRGKHHARGDARGHGGRPRRPVSRVVTTTGAPGTRSFRHRGIDCGVKERGTVTVIVGSTTPSGARMAPRIASRRAAHAGAQAPACEGRRSPPVRSAARPIREARVDHGRHDASSRARRTSVSMRSSSSGVSWPTSVPSSAATTFARDPSKNVSTRCRRADRRAECRGTVGA